MRSVSERAARFVAAGFVLLGCADGSPPTQPTSNELIKGAVVPPTFAEVLTTSTGTIYACYIPGKAIVYRIKVQGAPDQCAKSDVEFTIDQGVPGPRGPEGPTGPKGETGAQGPAGAGPLTGLSFHSQAVTLASDGRARLECPAGKAVLNFGWEITINSTAQPSQLKAVRPATDGTKLFWGIVGTAGTTLVAYWTCVDAVAGVATS